MAKPANGPRGHAHDAMSTENTLALRTTQPASSTEIETATAQLLADLRDLQRQAHAERTVDGYSADMREFVTWCETRQLSALPAAPLTVALYLADAAQQKDQNGRWFYKTTTLARWVAAINKAHELSRLPKPGSDPEVTTTMAGIRRDRAKPQNREHARENNEAEPLMLDDLRKTVAKMAAQATSYPAGVAIVRDIALFVIGWGGAFRRSELHELAFADARLHGDEGLRITVRRSKTDQAGHGMVKPLPYGENPLTCPVCAFYNWTRVRAAMLRGKASTKFTLEALDLYTHSCSELIPLGSNDLDAGFARAVLPLDELDTIPADLPLFPVLHRSGGVGRAGSMGTQAIQWAIQRRLREAGVPNVEKYSGHSLRAGFVTQAKRNRLSDEEIMRQTGHVNARTVRIYDRRHNPLEGNAVTEMGL